MEKYETSALIRLLQPHAGIFCSNFQLILKKL